MNDSVNIDDKAVATVESGGAVALPSSSTNDNYYKKASGPSYIGRVQLYSKGKAVDLQQIPARHWGIPTTSNKIIDLGAEPDFLILARRPKAMSFEHTDFPVVQSFDPESELFQSIETRANEGGEDNAATVGISFLIYERNSKRVLEYYASSKSALMACDTLFAFLPDGEKTLDQLDAVTFGSQVIEGRKYTYVAPTFAECSTPITGIDPTMAVEQIQKFLEAKDTDMSKASEEVSDEEAAAARSRSTRR